MRTVTVTLNEPAQEQPVVHVTLCAVCDKRIIYSEDHRKVRRAGRDYPVCSPACAETLESAPATYVMAA